MGREDVASVAVAAAMFQTPNYDDTESTDTPSQKTPPFHYTLACRWVGQEMDPFPSQGVKADGAEDAETALRRALGVIKKNEKRNRLLADRRRQKQAKGTLYDRTSASIYDWGNLQRKKIRTQPHGLCTAFPVYIMLGLFARTLLHPLIKVLPGGQSWVLPALAQLSEWMVLAASLVMGKLVSALPFLARQKQYILF